MRLTQRRQILLIVAVPALLSLLLLGLVLRLLGAVHIGPLQAIIRLPRHGFPLFSGFGLQLWGAATPTRCA